MSSVMNRHGEEAAERVRAWLAEQTFGTLQPRAVALRRAEDSTGVLAWYFEVTLPDPDPAQGTWPVADLEEIDRETRDHALEAGVPWPWYVQVQPESDEPQVDEDELD